MISFLLLVTVGFVVFSFLDDLSISIAISVSTSYVEQGDVAYNQGPRPTKLPDCMGYRA